MRKIPLLISLIVCSFHIVSAQVVDDLFQVRSRLSKDYKSIASRYQALELNPGQLANLHQKASSHLELKLPFEGHDLKLNLEKVKITSDNFSVVEASAGGVTRTIPYNDGIFYQGKIDGKSVSFATISIVQGQIFGIIADEKSNIILGAIEDNGRATNEYALYRESDLKIPNPLQCFTSDTPEDGPAPVHNNSQSSGSRLDAVGEPVDVYFECDFKFYQDKGSITNNVINYVLSFFNNTALLYANENIKIQVSQIKVWTELDPEAAAGLSSTSAILTAFRSRMQTTTYIGDYAHFLSTRPLGGGIAYLLSNPCSSTSRAAVSAINNSYNNFPTYSWTVEVVTHELGHNLGSPHTHSCTWPGGAIDWCGPTASASYIEGSCTPAPLPSGGGTIMSYCHLISVGINFNNGFGPLPGDRIRSVVGAASCFGTCRMTIEVNKQDASCNQANGTATVTTTNNTGALTYLWSNGQTGATLTGAAPGTYHVAVKDAAGCQVMQVFTIGNTGTALSFSLTPSGTAGFCTGGSITLNATSNPAYTYVWRKDNVVIPGAVGPSLTATAAGTYAVTATSGACSGTESVVVSVVPPPTANITPGGATTFCDGSNVVLDANAGSSYSYQWYRNGTLISGATNATFSAVQTGSYTVKVSAGTGCEVTSSAVAVTVNASPAAEIAAATPTSFCQGGSVTLNASTGTGYTYQWYRNGSPVSGATQPSYAATTSGSFTVATSIAGCSRTSTATNVVVWTNPVVNVTPVSSTIEKFQTQVLTATGAASYNWLVQPDLVGSTTTSGTFKPLTTSSYTITGTDANGCKGTANATISVIGCGDVTNMEVTTYSPSRVIIRWKNPDGATSDSVYYRKKGTTTWTKVFVTGEEYELNGLTPGTEYEYEIIPVCTTTTVFIPSAVEEFRTDNLEGGLYIRLFPNPVSATSKLEIITDNSFVLQVSVFDNMGRRVMNISPSENLPAGQVIKNVNPGTLPNGIYHVAVYVNGKVHNIKMVIMH